MDQNRRTKKRTIYVTDQMDRALRFLAYKRNKEVSPLCVEVLWEYIQSHPHARRFLENDQKE